MSSQSHHHRFTLKGLMTLVSAIALACWFMFHAVPGMIRESRPTARPAQCRNNLKQIQLGLSVYESFHGEPLPAVMEVHGHPHSWRVMLLPYIEQQDLFAEYALDEPWDSTHNRRLWDKMPLAYRCPDSQSTRNTSYVALTSRTTDKVHTVGELPASTICWTDPRDVPPPVFARIVKNYRRQAGRHPPHVSTSEIDVQPALPR